jgi:hypothetical protein
MTEETLEYKLAELTNETDPHVKFDPTFKKTIVAKEWVPLDKTEEGAPEVSAPSPTEENTKIDGVLIPIIKINSIVVPNTDIQYMMFDYTGFKPTLELTIRKSVFSKLETPGMVSKVTVIMIPPVDKTYRKISVDFYINDVSDYEDKFVMYSCSMFFPALEKKWTRSIKNDGDNKLNTFALCKSIANECGLGFAASNQCEEISDTKVRLMRSQTFQDIIKEHTEFGGLDNNSFFMSWIDVYGYIVLCNIAWIFSQATNVNELSMHMLEGMNVTNATDNPIKYGEKTFRTFTNWKSQAKKQSNYIQHYEWIVDNNSIKTFGTNNTYFTINHRVTGGNNDIVTETVKIEDKSADGQNYKDAYDFQDIKFLGVEMASKDDGNTPILYQKQRRNAYVNQLKAKKLKVVLNDLNINLERGTLINIQIFEFDKDAKIQLLNLTDNLSEKGNINSKPSDEIPNKKKILDNPDIGIPNLSISGIYFIDGIEYEYTKGMEKIEQTLYLIKQTPSNNYLNMSSLPKLSPQDE